MELQSKGKPRQVLIKVDESISPVPSALKAHDDDFGPQGLVKDSIDKQDVFYSTGGINKWNTGTETPSSSTAQNFFSLTNTQLSPREATEKSKKQNTTPRTIKDQPKTSTRSKTPFSVNENLQQTMKSEFPSHINPIFSASNNG